MSLKGFYKVLRSRVSLKGCERICPSLKKDQEHKIFQNQLKSYRRILEQHYPEEPALYVENEVDLELPPMLEWISDYVYSPQVSKPFESSIGCKCNSSLPQRLPEYPCYTNRLGCCASFHDLSYPYRRTKQVRSKQKQIIIECNKNCDCTAACPFRVIQNGRKHPLCIFRTPNGRGWGVKATNAIKSNSFIVEYLGEVIPHEEAERRGKLYDRQMMTYLFDLDFHGEAEFTIDASKYCNISHFINHSCDPNLVVKAALINHFDIRLQRLAFFSSKNISAGEELTFDYQMNCSDGTIDVEKNSSESASEFTVSDATSSASRNKVRCLCGSKICRGVLFN